MSESAELKVCPFYFVVLAAPNRCLHANAQRVLVTGGLGYIGSHVVVALLLTGRYLPVVVDNCHNAYPEAIRQCAEIARDVLG
jgi:UDP-glucose 4-epimerase